MKESEAIAELFEKTLDENEKLLERLPDGLLIGRDKALAEAKKTAKGLLDYGFQLKTHFEMAPPEKRKKISVSDKYLTEFMTKIIVFYDQSDNSSYTRSSRSRVLKEITMRYHALKPLFLFLHYGIAGERKSAMNFSTILKIAKKSIGLDEMACMCIASLGFLEIGMNRKLTDLGESTEGNFDKRYSRLVEVVKEKERRSLPAVLPQAMYKARSLLLHAGHTKNPTEKESEQIMQWIEDFLIKLFEK